MSACESYRNIVAFPTVCMKVPLFLPDSFLAQRGEGLFNFKYSSEHGFHLMGHDDDGFEIFLKLASEEK